MALLAVPLFAQLGGVGGFGGPSSIGSGIRLGDAREVGIRPWISANGVYVRNLEGSTIFGNQRRDNVMGGVLGGLAASKLWRRTSLTGAYMGSAYYSTRTVIANRFRSSHVGALALNHQVSRRVSLQLNQIAGSAMGGFGYGAGFGGFGALGIGPMSSIFSYGLLGGGGAGDPAVNGIVDSDIYDQRTNFYGSNGGVSINPTNRLSFSLVGGGIFVRRDLVRLHDLNTVNAMGSASYQLSRRLAFVASYGFGRFDYVRRFGTSDIQTGLGGFQYQLAERTFFGVFGGIQHLDRTFVGRVQVDPEVAELLGISTSYEIQVGERKGFTGGAQLSHIFRQGDFKLSVWRGMIPGTDVLLTSTRDRIMGSFARPLSPNDSLSFVGVYMRQKSLMQMGARLDLWQGGATYSRRIFSGLHLRFTGGYRRGESKLANRSLRQTFASVGIAWHPSDLVVF
jgi:hypothetical protein